MPSNVQGRNASPTNGSESQEERYRKKLQRILRAADAQPPNLSGAVSPLEQRRMSEQRKAATLAPRLVNPSTVDEDDSPLFQCTECDMIVKGSDPYCPFCGAIFADGPMAEEQPVEALEGESDKPVVEKPIRREPMVKPEKFDIFSIINAKPLSKDMLYLEARKGFSGSARLLEEIERMISEISSIGTDTSRARRLIGSAWEACRDGDWNLVQTLARQTEDLVAPSIPELVRSQIAHARKVLTDAKTSGVDIAPYVLQVKSAMSALHANNPDEALRITKELMDALREDSVTWK